MAVSSSKYEKFLGIHIDKKVRFQLHVRSLCKKSSQKLTFARTAFSLKFGQRKLLNAFITSQLNFKTIIQRLNNFLQRTVPSKFMTVIWEDCLLKYSKLK